VTQWWTWQRTPGAVGVSEPTLHRALTDLRTSDIVRTEYRHLVIRDPAALDALTSPR
jgi:hypothetical protein